MDLNVCPACSAESPVSQWAVDQDAFYCEDCGSHSGAVCPRCGHVADVVMTDIKGNYDLLPGNPDAAM